MNTNPAARYIIDLPRHHDVCEANYDKLTHLLPLEAGEHFALNIILSQHTFQVRFTVRERCPYTTLVDISFDSCWGGWITPPKLQVRIYHDVRMAEVANIDGKRQLSPRYGYPNPQMHQPDEKFQLNRFLSDCLDLCRKGGEMLEISDFNTAEA
ncbi:DUF1249 domain-containing protein [Spongorhabdus nitratireducens]